MDGIEGLESLMERLDALDGDELRDAVERGVKQGAEVIRKQAIGFVSPKAPDSSEIKKSIIVESVREADKITATVVATHETAIYAEFGTGQVGEKNHEGISPHVAVTYNVRAPRTYKWKGKKKLKNGEIKPYTRIRVTYGWFYPKSGDKGGEWGFTRGQPARPFLYPAFVAKRREAKRLISEQVAKVVKGE